MIDLAHSAGKYGAYIWPAYGVSLVGMIAMAVDTAFRGRRSRRDVERGSARDSAPGPDER